MRTLIVSDLHLGSNSGLDLIRRAELRATLLEEVARSDRLVLLGDVLELRHGPLRDAMDAARPVFEDLGRALGAGGELIVVAGNHDHALIEPWLARRGAEVQPPRLQAEQLMSAGEASAAYERISAWAAPARVTIAYPGVWLRPDVYATHGHYLDCHITVPTLERLSMGAMARLLGRRPQDFSDAADYEAIGSPIFAWRDAVARDASTGAALNGMATVSAWRALGGSSASEAGEARDGRGGAALNGRPPALRRPARSRARAMRRRALVAAFPAAVGLLNRAGLGPLHADISLPELRRAGLAAMGEVAARLRLGDAHVVFGHTHRAGPLPGDEEAEWVGRGGARLCNTGSWTYAGIFLRATPAESPYWPGGAVVVEDAGPPRVLLLLADRTREEIRPSAGSHAGAGRGGR
jgi:UDP-2,3-diacylglucosamine pyrophosphatase LpxH